jgi:hypothetical protein
MIKHFVVRYKNNPIVIPIPEDLKSESYSEIEVINMGEVFTSEYNDQLEIIQKAEERLKEMDKEIIAKFKKRR